jgi:hypothetical protein
LEDSVGISIFTLAVIAIVASSASVRWPQTDRQREALRGPVELVVCHPTPGLGIWLSCNALEWRYDRAGWLTEVVSMDSDGSPSTRTTYRRYEARGLVETISVNPQTGVETKTSSHFIRDPARGTVTYECTDPEHPERQSVCAEDRYDRHGRLVETSGYCSNPPGSIRHDTHFLYDQKGQVAKKLEYDPHGPYEATVAFKYDAAGQVAEETWSSNDGRIASTIRYTYTFDSHGNWVERTSQRCTPPSKGSDRLVCEEPRTEKRTITYYDEVPTKP